MRQIVTCFASEYAKTVDEYINFGWKVVEKEELRDRDNKLTKFRIAFEMDDNIPNKEKLLYFQSQYKVRNKMEEPHTVKAIVWGVVMCMLAVLTYSLCKNMVEDVSILWSLTMLPTLGGSAMIATGIIFRVVYSKKVASYKRDQQLLISNAKALLNSNNKTE